jgi:cytochrome c oxidase subunit II
VIRPKKQVNRWWCLAAGLAPGVVFAEYGIRFPKPVTPIAHRVSDLHNLSLIVCGAIFFVVFSAMLYSIAMHRKARGVKPARFHENIRLEIAWAAIPFLIVVGVAAPSVVTLLQMGDVSRAEMTVKITGYQWKWRYDYADGDVGFFSALSTPRDQIENRAQKGEQYLLDVDKPLVLPARRKVRFLITSADVIHSWWVPAFAAKKDAVPGFVNEFWTLIEEPGIYRGQCAELCGKDHAFMPIVVQVLAPDEFDKWLNAQKEKIPSAPAAPLKTAIRGRATGDSAAPMSPFGAPLSDNEIVVAVTFERGSFGDTGNDLMQVTQVRALR